MFYRQSLQNIQVVFISLDGALLDLNHLRYNYIKKLGHEQGREADLVKFDRYLGNYQTGYDFLDFDFDVERMEDELFEYAKYATKIKKTGSDELLKFLNSRGIKVAIYTTYKAKRAISYLQLSKLDQYVDYVIGGDCECAHLPDNEIIELVLEKFGICRNELLVVAPYKSLVAAANQSYCNVIFLKDLVEADLAVERMVYKVATNCFEIMNLFLFDRFDDNEIYGGALNFSRTMDEGELEKTYNHLVKEFADDPELLRLVRQSYFYYLGELQNRHFEEFGKNRLKNIDYSKLNEGLMLKDHDLEVNQLKEKIEKTLTLDVTKLAAHKGAPREESPLDRLEVLEYGQTPNYIKTQHHYDSKEPGNKAKREQRLNLRDLVAKDAKDLKVQMVAKNAKFDPEVAVALPVKPAEEEAELQLDFANVTANQKDTLDMLSALHTREITKKELSETGVKEAQDFQLDYNNDFYYQKRGPFAWIHLVAVPFVATLLGMVAYRLSGAPFENQTGYLEILDSLLDFYLDGILAIYQTLIDFVHVRAAFVPSFDALLASDYRVYILFGFYFLANMVIYDSIVSIVRFVRK